MDGRITTLPMYWTSDNYDILTIIGSFYDNGKLSLSTNTFDSYEFMTYIL